MFRRNAKELKYAFPELEELKQLTKDVVVDDSQTLLYSVESIVGVV